MASSTFESRDGREPVSDRGTAVPASNVEGELLAKRRRSRQMPEPFVRQKFDESMVTRRSEAAHNAVKEQLRNLDYGGRFTPPSTRGTIIFPGFQAAPNGADRHTIPRRIFFYVNANEMGWVLRLVPPSEMQRKSLASRIYASRCASCHRQDMKERPRNIPPSITCQAA